MYKFLNFIYLLPLCLILTACNFSVSSSPGSLEDKHRLTVEGNLDPLPAGYYDFALETSQMFFLGGKDAVSDRLHSALESEKDLLWRSLGVFASDSADFSEAEYFGHGFGQAEGQYFVVIHIKVPNNSGYNVVKATMPYQDVCCQLAGLDIVSEKIKSFKLKK